MRGIVFVVLFLLVAAICLAADEELLRGSVSGDLKFKPDKKGNANDSIKGEWSVKKDSPEFDMLKIEFWIYTLRNGKVVEKQFAGDSWEEIDPESPVEVEWKETLKGRQTLVLKGYRCDREALDPEFCASTKHTNNKQLSKSW